MYEDDEVKICEKRYRVSPTLKKFFGKCEEIRAKWTAPSVAVFYYPDKKVCELKPLTFAQFKRVNYGGKKVRVLYVDVLKRSKVYRYKVGRELRKFFETCKELEEKFNEESISVFYDFDRKTCDLICSDVLVLYKKNGKFRKAEVVWVP